MTQGTHSSPRRIQHGATTTAALAGPLRNGSLKPREGFRVLSSKGSIPRGSGCSAPSPAPLNQMLQLEVSEECLWFKNPP